MVKLALNYSELSKIYTQYTRNIFKKREGYVDFSLWQMSNTLERLKTIVGRNNCDTH